MRQAFQIRLSQLEKRYRRQLVLEQRRNSTNGRSPIQPRRLSRKMNPLSPHSYPNSGMSATGIARRNSWHSAMSDDEELDKLVGKEKRSGSVEGAESDCSIDESDIEPEKRQRFPRVLGELPGEFSGNHLRDPGQNPPQQSTPKSKLGLKGGARSWQEELIESSSPRMSPIKGFYDDEIPSEAAKVLIHEKVRTHQGKMVKYFREKSEAKISSIEKQYQQQIGEVERKYKQRATQQLTHLESRLKDLECRLDVQTLV